MKKQKTNNIEITDPNLSEISIESIAEVNNILLEVVSGLFWVTRQLTQLKIQTPPQGKTIYEALMPDVKNCMLKTIPKLGQAIEAMEFLEI